MRDPIQLWYWRRVWMRDPIHVGPDNVGVDNDADDGEDGGR